MRAKDDSLINLISKKERTFYVPPYQRNYKWEKTKEIKELIADINHFVSTSKLESYFIGSIILKKHNGPNFNYILVDGQQRITTIFLMCKALYDVLQAGTLKQRAFMVLESERGKFNLLNAIDNQSLLNTILNGDHNLLTKKEKSSNYFVVYKHFQELFQNKSHGENETFFLKGISNLKVAIIELEQEEDEFSVYESINSKGKTLSSTELIKNYILMVLELNENGNRKKLLKLFQDDFINQLNEKDLTDLYRQKLAIETGKLFSKNSKALYYAWKESFPKNQINANLINDLLYDLAIFKYIKNHDWGNKALPLIEASLMNIYALIHLVVKVNSQFEDKQLEITNFKNIEFVINYLAKLFVARMLYSFGRVEANRSYAKLAFKLAQELQNNDFKVAITKIINELENVNNNARMPKYDEITNGVVKRDISLNANVLRWTLIALEQIQTGQKLSLLKKISLKNIFVKTLDDNDHFELSDSEILETEALVNTLGNFALTNTNPPLWTIKSTDGKQFLHKKSDLEINKMIYEFEKWNHKAIKKRTKKLLSQIATTWNLDN